MAVARRASLAVSEQRMPMKTHRTSYRFRPLSGDGPEGTELDRYPHRYPHRGRTRADAGVTPWTASNSNPPRRGRSRTSANAPIAA